MHGIMEGPGEDLTVAAIASEGLDDSHHHPHLNGVGSGLDAALGTAILENGTSPPPKDVGQPLSPAISATAADVSASGSPAASPSASPKASPAVSPAASPSVSPKVSPPASPKASPKALAADSPSASPSASPVASSLEDEKEVETACADPVREPELQDVASATKLAAEADAEAEGSPESEVVKGEDATEPITSHSKDDFEGEYKRRIPFDFQKCCSLVEVFKFLYS